MPSAYSVPIASDVLPEPDTPTTATVRHSGTSTSTSCRLLCRAPRTPMTAGKVPGTEILVAAIPGNLRPSVSGCPAKVRTGAGACPAPGALWSRKTSLLRAWADRSHLIPVMRVHLPALTIASWTQHPPGTRSGSTATSAPRCCQRSRRWYRTCTVRKPCSPGSWTGRPYTACWLTSRRSASTSSRSAS